jgi:benzoylformate decarboxylase
MTTSVRQASLAMLRRHGLTRLFSNPGSTEVAFLADLPDDFEFVLALHEASVVGLATGWAVARQEPAVVLLHTTAGLGNAVGALATARANGVPLVVIVGQQDRRHLDLEPFLAGRLDGLAGDYPVWVNQPARPADVPAAISRAYQEAISGRGPAIVIVPMDDWQGAIEADEPVAAPLAMLRARGTDEAAVAALADFLAASDSPLLVVGAGIDDERGWIAVVSLAEHLGVPVWQEAFGARAGFPQDHPLFAGHLPAHRPGLRGALAGHDAVLAIGAPVFRQYPYLPGGLVEPGTRIAILTADAGQAHGSAADLAVLAAIAPTCEQLVARLPAAAEPAAPAPAQRPEAPPTSGPLRAAHVFAALAERLPDDAVVIEEAPSNRRELSRYLPAKSPLGFLSAAMGGLGFALPAAAGIRMALPERGVVALVGDGSSMYSIQALWSAVEYGIGVAWVILDNGGYAIMDHLAREAGGAAPWPRIDHVDLSSLARGYGCEARHVASHENLLRVFDEELSDLASRTTPILIDVAIDPEPEIVP